MTPGKLAAAAGCSEVHVTSILGGHRSPSIPLLHRLAVAVGSEYRDLLDANVMSEAPTPLQAKRIAAGIRPADLASQVRISPDHLSSLETGRRNPSERVLRELATALGCKPDDLIRQAAA